MVVQLRFLSQMVVLIEILTAKCVSIRYLISWILAMTLRNIKNFPRLTLVNQISASWYSPLLNRNRASCRAVSRSLAVSIFFFFSLDFEDLLRSFSNISRRKLSSISFKLFKLYDVISRNRVRLSNYGETFYRFLQFYWILSVHELRYSGGIYWSQNAVVELVRVFEKLCMKK